MRVVFDNIIFFLQKSGGGSVYWAELIKRANVDNVIEPIFSEPNVKCENRLRNSIKIKVTLIEKLPLLFLRLMNFSRKIQDIAIFHSSYYRISNSRKTINVITIHDFTSELFFTGLRKFIHTRRKWNGIKKADGIICISQNTKADLLKFYPTVNENKITVIYNGVGDEFFNIVKESVIIADYSPVLTKKYILYIGHRTSYKNFMIAAAAVAMSNDDIILLIIGEALTQLEKTELAKLSRLEYVCLTGVDSKSLNVYYNFAYCLIYPSAYEGFGIPIVEAMKAGCPVVTTDKSSIPEVTGNAAIMVNEISARSFANAFSHLSDNVFRNELIENGFRQAGKFSWDKCFSEVKDFYLALHYKALN